MEKVVYLTGAGFSAPLGLPVMSNFLIKSKDQYFQNPDKFIHFKQVFDTIQKMSIVKNYYSADLFNIEEILSILEMEEYLSELEGTNSDIFKKYIKDVIEFYTPKMENYGVSLPANWYDFVFGRNKIQNYYGFFIANILNLKLNKNGGNNKDVFITTTKETNVKYSIITLNYDLVFENFLKFIKDTYNLVTDINYKFTYEESQPHDIYLAKLHGSINNLTIVPPTWNKNSNSDLSSVWSLAKKILEEANHIRILGYSLPLSDSYIKYLLKSAILDSKHLKTIDVINLDPYGVSKKRYDEFVKFNYYRYINANIEDYLRLYFEKYRKEINFKNELNFNTLESYHMDFIEKRI